MSTNTEHRYRVTTSATPEGNTRVGAEGLPDIAVAPPRSFGGPGNVWSPEELLVAALAECFVLSFRAVAERSRLPWQSLECEVEGTLERVDKTMAFTAFRIDGTLVIGADADPDRARKLLDRAEQTCFISNSLKAPCHQQVNVTPG